jgi:hypothetical protein
LADAGERLIVNVDNLDRRVRIVLARGQALVLVEDEQTQLLERQRIPGAQREHGREYGKW